MVKQTGKKAQENKQKSDIDAETPSFANSGIP